MTPFQIYLISQADSIINFLTGITWLMGAITGLCFITAAATIDKESDSDVELYTVSSNLFKKFLIAFIFSATITFLIPSTKTLVAMYTIPPIVNNQTMKKLPANLINFANDWLTKQDKEAPK